MWVTVTCPQNEALANPFGEEKGKLPFKKRDDALNGGPLPRIFDEGYFTLFDSVVPLLAIFLIGKVAASLPLDLFDGELYCHLLEFFANLLGAFMLPSLKTEAAKCGALAC
jgi:hypothetical protein